MFFMKIANEYAPSFDVQGNTDFSVKEITDICNDIGPRKPGSPEELKAQKFMQRILDKYCEKTEIEDFTLHRQGFMGFIPFTVCMGVASVFVNWFGKSWIAFIMCILAFIPLIFEFLMYKEFDDFLFPKQTSHNLIGTKAPKGEVKQRIVLVGHSDSQFEWPINYYLGGLQAKLFVEIPAVIGLVIQTIFALICIFAGAKGNVGDFANAGLFFKIFFIVSIIFIPFEISFIFFQSWTKSVPGASDNLSGCYVGIGTLKALREAGVDLEQTELMVICSGSEEAGLRGAKAYAKRHEKELKDIPSICIGLDTFRDLEDMAVYDRDLSGTLQHDWGVKNLVKNAAANCGYDLKFESIYIGACDAAAFEQQGIPSTGFAAMNPDPPRYYHTRLDNPENLRPEAIAAGIEIMIETVCMYDKEGLPKKA
ncbi:MAG: Zn-dependent exopeptidase M28 [Ruminococcaceae bacterium]|nr:Zn-dependent exopeptidase M28 [Oscillospiraceae bacterium]